MDQIKKISFVIPMFNERESLPLLMEKLSAVSRELNLETEVILVDDESTDHTETFVCNMEKADVLNTIRYIKLSKNHGQDLALKCGVDHATGDVVAMLDADLQHPPEKVIEAVELIKSGVDIVHIVREEPPDYNLFRRIGSRVFHRILNFLSEREFHLTDFKVISRRVADQLKNLKEINYFSRGMIEYIGFQSATIFYQPNMRLTGKSKYSFRKLLKLAFESIIAYSVKPLRVAIYVGLFISLFSFVYAAFIIFEKIFLGQPIPGFPTLATALFFLSGVQLLFLGLLGEYIGKTFLESKRRPQYFIEKIIVR